MGLFQVQRELAGESKRKKKTASAKARTLEKDASALAESAWSDLDPKTLEPLYQKLAKTHREVELVLARLASRSQESKRALVEENAALAAPLVASWLKTDRAPFAAQVLASLGARRALPALREGAESADAMKRAWCAFAIATIGDADDVAFAARIAGDKPPIPLVCALAKRQVPAYVSRAVDEVRGWLDHRKTKSLHRDDAANAIDAIDALGAARAEEALPVLHDALRTPYLGALMRALAAIAHPSSREPIEALLATLAGDPIRNLAYRLPAENVLRAIDPRERWPSLDTARLALAHLHPRRYGWPKVDDWADLVAHAVHALATQGTNDDVARAARFANAPFKAVRDAARGAYEKVHGAPPALDYWDEARTALAVKRKTPAKELVASAQRDVTVFRHNLFVAVAKTKDAKARGALAAFLRGELESRENHAVSYYESSDLGPDAHGMVAAITELARTPAIKKKLATTTSLWIRHVLGNEPTPSEWPTGPTFPTPLHGRVRKLGARGGGSFAIGRHTNGLAYSHDGSMLAAVGDSLGLLLDAKSGVTKTTLELRFNWAYGCVFSNDDKHLYVAYHGGHLEVFDTTTGKPVRSIGGHGGVPDGIRGIAMSPDGKYLLTAGSDGLAFLRHVPSGKVIRKFESKIGTFYGCAFSRDSSRFALSYLRKDGQKHGDALHVGDCATGKSKITETASSMWALAFAANGTLVTAGEGKQILFLNEKFQPARKLSQGDVVRLAFAHGDKTLVAISQTGEAKAWDLASGKATTLEAGGPLWALAHDDATDVIAIAGTEGVVHRFDASLAKIGGGAPLALHTGQARGFAVLRDGRFFSCGWDGRLLLWDGAHAKLVHKLEHRMTEIVLSPNEHYVLVLHNQGALCFDVTTLTLLGDYAPKISNASTTNPESLGVSGDVVAVGHYGGFVRTFTLPVLEPRGEVSLGKNEVSALVGTGDGGFICGTDDGRVARISPSLEVEWSIADHGRDLVEGEPMGNPHKTVAAVALHGGTLASTATDESVRVYDVSGARPVPKKRVLTHAGLFNNVTFSPSGARVVCPSSWGFEVYDATMGTLLCKLARDAFDGADELTRAAPVDEDTILVGAENGNVYEVKLA